MAQYNIIQRRVLKTMCNNNNNNNNNETSIALITSRTQAQRGIKTESLIISIVREPGMCERRNNNNTLHLYTLSREGTLFK